MSDAQWKQWNRIVNKKASPSAPICPSAIGDERWGAVMEKVQAGRASPSMQRDFLVTTENWARALVKRKVKERGAFRRKGWATWIREQVKGGGSGLHRFVKRGIEKPEQILWVRGGPSASPQDIADNDLLEWEKIWKMHGGRACAP